MTMSSGSLRSIATAGCAALAVLVSGMPSWAKSDIPDFGTTYWQNGDRDVLVLKFDGYRLKIGSSMVPCFVGTLDRHSDFVGGGLGFGGAYVPQRVKLDVIHAYAGAVVVHG